MNTADLYTYAIQQHKTNGCTYVIEYDGNTIHGTFGPLSQDEAHCGQDDRLMRVLPEMDYEPSTNPSGLDENGFVEWHPPTATYDPNTDEVWTDTTT